VLHFAPEPCLRRIIQEASAYYRSADFAPAPDSLLLNIEKIDLPDHSVDVVIANHVLEHVDDLAALRELRRILSDRGRMIVSIPIIEGWATTYENPSIKSKVEREIHFGQADHLRFYGRDFRDRVLSAGFSLEEFVADGPDAARYALTRGDAIFICTKV
jgi:SAM-dependent methyltransferase